MSSTPCRRRIIRQVVKHSRRPSCLSLPSFRFSLIKSTPPFPTPFERTRTSKSKWMEREFSRFFVNSLTNLTSHLQLPVSRPLYTAHAITSLCPACIWDLERTSSQRMVHLGHILPLSDPPAFLAHDSPTVQFPSPVRSKRESSPRCLQTHQRSGIILPSAVFLHASPSHRVPVAFM